MINAITVQDLINLLDVIIWPLTILAIVILFRNRLSDAIQRVQSIQADATGISLTLEKKLAAAKNLLMGIKPVTAKSTPKPASSVDKTLSPYQQLLQIQNKLHTRLDELVIKNQLKFKELNPLELTEKLAEIGVIRIDQARCVTAALDISYAADATVTQEQVNVVIELFEEANI